MKWWVTCGLMALLLAAAPGRAAEPRRAAIVVYGGTAGGVVAAVAAAREGQSVLLLEPGRHVGGMASGGLGATDTGNRAAIRGYSREFFDRIRDHYVRKYGPASDQARDCSDGFHFEPHVAEEVFRNMLKEAKVEVVYEQRVDRVTRDGNRIKDLRTTDGLQFSADVFIDASYEGDLLARAAVSYTVGRESAAQYKESLAGVQKLSPSHQWPVKVSAFNMVAELLPFVQPGASGEPGAGDKKVQAYNFRLCMTDRKDNQAPFPKPTNYDANRFELLARYLAKRPTVRVGQLMNPVRMPNGKTDTNNNGPFSTDYIGTNWDYPEADYATRERIWKDHVEYTQGFLYFLANDPRVPEALGKEMSAWGLAKDEFTDTGNWPHQLYVREARRLLGEYVMTQADITENRSKPDSVGLGSYNTDSHHVQRVADKDGNVINEGDFQVRVAPYAIPYRSLVPKQAECENLLVPVCVSASHVAYGTVRMEPVYMILGQAAGVAASLAVRQKAAVQKVPLEALLARLRDQKAVLSADSLPRQTSGAAHRLDASKLAGLVLDDAQATKTGDWVGSTSAGPFVGEGYLHDNNQEKGKKAVRFTPHIAKAGKFEVFLFYSPHANRASNVPVVVRSADGEKQVAVDQRRPLEQGKPVRLGVFFFRAGTDGWVEVRTDGTTGYVIADAVQLVSQD